MATKIKVWEIENGRIVPRDNAAFADSHREDELEGWITQSPDILGEKLLIIARQLIVPDVGRLDLLGMDENGKLVIIELKRDLGPREAVAQGLDYASWLSSASEEEVLAHANQYLQTQSGDTDRDLAQGFEEAFGKSLPEWVCQNHKVVLVAAGLDASAERIVNYLARKSVDINAIFFNYAELSDGKQIIVRSVLVPESVLPPKTGEKEWRTTEPVLLALASERKTAELVRICRQMRDVWEERTELTAGGSFRYWAAKRMVYGVNVSGKLDVTCPIGQLDIWVRTDTLANVTEVAEEAIKQRLSRDFKPFDAGRMDFVVRLKNTRDADLLVSQLRELVAEQSKKSMAVA